MKLFIDANVIPDVLCDRKGFVENSSLIWKLCETGGIFKTAHARKKQ